MSDGIEQLLATEAIKQAKARYFRGVDTSNGELVRAMLHPDCQLDYRGCCTDPATGHDFLPAMNVLLQGRAAWSDGAMAAAGIVSVHQGSNFDITLISDHEARMICAMTDRLYMPPGKPFGLLCGYGYYHETYVRTEEGWLLKQLSLVRIRVEVS